MHEPLYVRTCNNIGGKILKLAPVTFGLLIILLAAAPVKSDFSDWVPYECPEEGYRGFYRPPDHPDLNTVPESENITGQNRGCAGDTPASIPEPDSWVEPIPVPDQRNISGNGQEATRSDSQQRTPTDTTPEHTPPAPETDRLSDEDFVQSSEDFIREQYGFPQEINRPGHTLSVTTTPSIGNEVETNIPPGYSILDDPDYWYLRPLIETIDLALDYAPGKAFWNIGRHLYNGEPMLALQEALLMPFGPVGTVIGHTQVLTGTEPTLENLYYAGRASRAPKPTEGIPVLCPETGKETGYYHVRVR